MGLSRTCAILLLIGMVVTLFLACRKESTPGLPKPVTSVVFDPEDVPYPYLSDYRFFSGRLADLSPVDGVLPYTVINPLFSDHALKERFVWMIPGTHARYAGEDEVLAFPDGTMLIKNFLYDRTLPNDVRRIMETRLMYKLEGRWHFANYIWNEDQTDAVLNTGSTTTSISWTDDPGHVRNVVYRTPSAGECLACHKRDAVPIPIGPKPRNLRMPHGYTDGIMDQLLKWSRVGYVREVPTGDGERMARWNDTNEDMTRRVRAYLDMNCAHCHSEGGHCDYRPMRFAWHETKDPAALGICVPAEEEVLPSLRYIVTAGDPEHSMLHHRMASTDEAVRMPLLGRSIVHEEGLALITAWIKTLEPPCD